MLKGNTPISRIEDRMGNAGGFAFPSRFVVLTRFDGRTDGATGTRGRDDHPITDQGVGNRQ
jgi:hypothetical protein